MASSEATVTYASIGVTKGSVVTIPKGWKFYELATDETTGWTGSEPNKVTDMYAPLELATEAMIVIGAIVHNSTNTDPIKIGLQLSMDDSTWLPVLDPLGTRAAFAEIQDGSGTSSGYFGNRGKTGASLANPIYVSTEPIRVMGTSAKISIIDGNENFSGLTSIGLLVR